MFRREDASTKGRCERRLRTLGPICIYLAFLTNVTGCAEQNDPDTLRANAETHFARQEWGQGLALLRKAAALSPSDRTIRIDLATAYLALKNGNLALAAIENAERLGKKDASVTLMKARALLLAGKHLELTKLPQPHELRAADALEYQYHQAEAWRHLAEKGLVKDLELVRRYLALFNAIESAQHEPRVAQMQRALELVRADDRLVERAWQHFACRKLAQKATSWAPRAINQDIVRVGPGRALKTPGEAAAKLGDGSIIEIDAGTYVGGVARWHQNDLTVRGVGGRPMITANGKSVAERDVWLFEGDRVTVENVEISGARSPYKNGAAIRHIGADLTLRHVYLHDNENGVLTGNRNPESSILIEHSEFARNGDDAGFAHNVYIGRSGRFELRYSYSHEARSGHLVKTRAQQNHINYNRLSDEESGVSSYAIDIPEGGLAVVAGNIIVQGPRTLNHGVMSFGAEDLKSEKNNLRVVNNTIYNQHLKAIIVRNPKQLEVDLVNNLVAGAPFVLTTDKATRITNQTAAEHGLRDPRNFDFSLSTGASAIDAGSNFDFAVAAEYVHPVSWRPRANIWLPDIGAYEHCGL